MKRKRTKLLSFFVALSFLMTSIGVPSIAAWAQDFSNGNSDSGIILEEGFIGEKKESKPANSGWMMTRNGEVATLLGGYDSTGNYGKEKPSFGFGRMRGSKNETLESPSFTLTKDGTLSFWYKAQRGNSEYTSSLKVEILVSDKWQEVQGYNLVDTLNKGTTFETAIPKETTKVKFSFSKVVGNLAIDDITIKGNGSSIAPPDPKPDPNPDPGVKILTIAEARALEKGKEVTVKGVVSFNDRNSTLHIQDETGAVAISNYKSKIDLSTVKSGNLVQVTGTLDGFHNLIQIQASDVKVVSDQGMPAPKTLTIKELKEKNYDSLYIKIEKAIIDVEKKTLTQGADSLDIYFVPSDINVKTGDEVNVQGTIGRYDSNVQIYGSSCTFTLVNNNDKEAPVIKHTQIEKASLNKDLEIMAQVSDNRNVEKVTLNYRAKGETTFKNIDMAKDGENSYKAVIPAIDVVKTGIEYYIEATDGVNTSKLPKENAFLVEVSDKDIDGPEIFELLPAEGGSVGTEEKPMIKASLKDASGVDKSSIKIFFDEEDVTAKADVKELSVSYVPENSLKDGVHTVKVEAKDMLGNGSSKEWSFRKGQLQHLFGQLHSHTNISDGSGTLDEAYDWAKAHGADYIAVTDHSNWFDNDTSANLADGSMSKAWTGAHVTADKHNEPGTFTSIYGYEMTWSGSTGGWGHINTFNTPGFETRTNKSMDLKKYYDTLPTQPQSISQLNHPGKTFGDFADFGFYTAAADSVVNMVEVGNGEGPIRGSGYFPSYQYYTRALDKGWHLAPTNNQDNHKGKWYSSNDARTVIITDNNSRESIYDALRNRRVYASEDPDMTVDYSVNGNLMGSFLGNVDKLDFKININDNDQIKKVSIIANGGVVVESKEFNSNNVNWELELNPQYTYYYVRVDQADKDIAVTAPVWVGENISAGFTAMSTDKPLTISKEEANVSVGVYNNGTSPIKNAKIEFFKNEISDENKIGEKTIETIDTSKTENVSMPISFDKTGEYTIYAKASLNIGGKDRIFTTSVKIKVINKEDAHKVVIDGAHCNQYVTGNYAGKLTKLQQLLQDRGCITTINNNTLTDETLKDAKLLILTDPQSVDDSKFNLKKSKFEKSEIEVIKRYVDRGGNIIISSKADYKDGTGDYSNSAQLNPILEAIGSELRLNDDEVLDQTVDGEQKYRLYLSRFSSENYNLTEGMENDKDKFSFYSGCSVILADGSNGGKVDFLVKGYDTTETLDSDNAGDNVAVEKGKVNVTGAEMLDSGAKVVASGNTFFSDFEIDGTNGEQYCNIKLTNNVLNWMLPAKKAPTAKIADIRKDENKDGVPDLLEQRFTIEGTVTSQSEAISPKNSFFEVVYVEDETGGICVFGVSKTPLKVGQKIRVTGAVDCYQGEFEIQVSDEDSEVQIIDEAINPIEPTKLSTIDSMNPINGGKLVKVEGKVVDINGSNLYIDDGTGVSRVYVEGYIWDGINADMKGKWNPDIKIGDNVSAVGLASFDPEGARLRVRNTAEIVKVDKQSEPTNPEDPNKPSDPENQNKPGNSTSQGNKLPQTGGFDYRLIIVAASISVLAGAYLVLRSRRKEN